MPAVYLFDLDGTLVDTNIYAKIYPKIITLIRKKRKLALTQIDSQAQKWELKKNRFGRYDSGDLCRGFNLLKEYYSILEKHITPPHKKILPLFRQLKKQKKKIGLVSNSMRRTIKLYLQKYRLAKYVDFIFSAEDACCRKNDTKYWKKLIRQQKLIPKEGLVIGDDRIEDKIIPQKLGFKSHLITNPSTLKSLTAKII